MKHHNITEEQRKELFEWIHHHKDINWGSWDPDEFPSLPGEPVFLQYDIAPVVVKFKEPIRFTNHRLNESIITDYISSNRKCPGANGAFALHSQLAPKEVVDRDRRNDLRRQYYKAKLREAELNMWAVAREEERDQVSRLHKELVEIKGTPNSKERRNELEAKLLKHIRKPSNLRPKWIDDALTFDTVEDYIKVRMARPGDLPQKERKEKTKAKSKRPYSGYQMFLFSRLFEVEVTPLDHVPYDTSYDFLKSELCKFLRSNVSKDFSRSEYSVMAEWLRSKRGYLSRMVYNLKD